MTCALCHSYTTCKYAVGRFRMGFIKASDGFMDYDTNYCSFIITKGGNNGNSVPKI